VSGAGIGYPEGGTGRRTVPDPLQDAYQNRPTLPAEGRASQGSTTMLGELHQELARTRHREACLQARRIRLRRAARAQRRARRAVEVAVRASERVPSETVLAVAGAG
jgi:hypothetical protein